jgi:hypothetical protein
VRTGLEKVLRSIGPTDGARSGRVPCNSRNGIGDFKCYSVRVVDEMWGSFVVEGMEGYQMQRAEWQGGKREWKLSW